MWRLQNPSSKYATIVLHSHVNQWAHETHHRLERAYMQLRFASAIAVFMGILMGMSALPREQ